MKPILFGSKMVCAILDGRKTVTRRVVKFPRGWNPVWSGYIPDGATLYGGNNIPAAKAPYKPGDILWVRETFRVDYLSNIPGAGRVQYKDGTYMDIRFHPDRYDMMRRAQRKPGWRPNENMPREAARIFLRVTGVRVERLQDITPEQIDAEGCKEWAYSKTTGELLPSGPSWFRIAWNDTVKPKDRDRYGWDANPWVWVIGFEKISEDSAGRCDR